MIKISPPNSIVFICDPSSREVDVPEYVNGQLVAATQSCISVGTLAEMDGETEISLSRVATASELGEMVFEGILLTPGKVVAVCNARDETLLSLPVSSVAVRVKVFANDHSEPDRIVVLASSERADQSSLHKPNRKCGSGHPRAGGPTRIGTATIRHSNVYGWRSCEPFRVSVLKWESASLGDPDTPGSTRVD